MKFSTTVKTAASILVTFLVMPKTTTTTFFVRAGDSVSFSLKDMTPEQAVKLNEAYAAYVAAGGSGGSRRGLAVGVDDGDRHRKLSGTATTYSDRNAFEAAAPGLPVEDFEGSNPAFIGCGAFTFTSASPILEDPNMCFATGEFLPGIRVSSPGNFVSVVSGTFLSFISSDAAAADSQFFQTVFSFDGGPTAVGLDIGVSISNINIIASDPNIFSPGLTFGEFSTIGVTIEFVDSSPSEFLTANTNSFFGVISHKPIRRITLGDDGFITLFDNVLFGIPGDNTGSYADPHFTTWSKEHFDFQGECDLVLVDNPSFMDGLGMTVHGRTKLHGTWSAFESAAIKIGDDVLEVHGSDPAIINGKQHHIEDIKYGTEYAYATSVGGYSLTVQHLGPHSRRHIIHFGNGERIFINNFKEFVDFEVESPRSTEFAGSVGLLGSYNTGTKLARDGKTVIEDADEFGQEWQVIDTDTQLFSVVDGPQYPEKCNMPVKLNAVQRHLRAMTKKISEDQAKQACSKAPVSRMENCIADVFGSDNLDMAGIYVH